MDSRIQQVTQDARGRTRLSAASRSRVAPLERRPVHLPPQDRQLVAQHEDLQLLRTFAAREQHYQRESPAGEDLQKRRD